MCFKTVKEKTKEVVLHIPRTAGYITLFNTKKILKGYDENAEVFLPDGKMRVFEKDRVQKCQSLEEISSLKFVDTTHDCDDFAAKLFGKFAGLV